LEPRNNGALLRVRIRSYSACIFADEHRRSGHHVNAALASGHGWKRHRDLVLAGAVRSLRRMTPDAAQQRGVLSYGQCQHDRNESCSEHREYRGQDAHHHECAQNSQKLAFLAAFGSLSRPHLRNLADEMLKIPHQSSSSQTAARDSDFGGGSPCATFTGNAWDSKPALPHARGRGVAPERSVTWRSPHADGGARVNVQRRVPAVTAERSTLTRRRSFRGKKRGNSANARTATTYLSTI